MKLRDGSRCHVRWVTSERKIEAEIVSLDLSTKMLSQFDLMPLLGAQVLQLDESSLTGWTSPSRQSLSASQNFTDQIKNPTSPNLVYEGRTESHKQQFFVSNMLYY